MKIPRIRTLLAGGFFALLLGTIVFMYITPVEDVVRIKMSKQKYYSWIEEQRPYLKDLEEMEGFDRRVELFTDGPHVYPYVVYEVFYGELDGMASFSYKLDIKDDYGPKSIRDEDISLILLPASEQIVQDGRDRNFYWGRYLEPDAAADMVSRILTGDRLLDVRKSIEERPDMPLSCWADTDKLADLKPRQQIEQDITPDR